MGPLSGLRVVEMTGLAPAPYCAMLLADLGAEVVRIDRPGGTRLLIEPHHDILSRNRPAIDLDLKSAGGRGFVLDAVDHADVLIEGFRPGVMERLGLGPDECLARNPRLVYGRVTGYGQDGPMAMTPGHDLNYIALSSALHHIGEPGAGPTIPLNLLGDFAGGGMLLAFGILAAVFEAGRSGCGQVVDAAMVEGAASLMSFLFALDAAGLPTGRGESGLSGVRPQYGVYETSDGLYVSPAASEPTFFSRMLTLLGLDAEGERDSRQDPARWPALKAEVARIFRSRTRDEWCAIFEGEETCFAPVLDMTEALGHPHNRHRRTFVEVEGVPQPAPVPRFSRTVPPEPRRRDGESVTRVIESWRERPRRSRAGSAGDD